MSEVLLTIGIITEHYLNMHIYILPHPILFSSQPSKDATVTMKRWNYTWNLQASYDEQNKYTVWKECCSKLYKQLSTTGICVLFVLNYGTQLMLTFSLSSKVSSVLFKYNAAMICFGKTSNDTI